ncbi:MAG: hypothetical protein WCE75_10710, partial [Terracidiphilus sp.]
MSLIPVLESPRPDSAALAGRIPGSHFIPLGGRQAHGDTTDVAAQELRRDGENSRKPSRRGFYETAGIVKVFVVVFAFAFSLVASFAFAFAFAFA